MSLMRKITLAALVIAGSLAAQTYTLGPDSQRQPGVPQGKVTKYTWSTSKVFPGSTRDYWVYVPAQYNAAKPACAMIFLDGSGWQSETGAFRAPVVMDNLIHQGAMPATIGIFINPGVMPAASPGGQSRFNRSYEYDALGDRNARFLIEEIIPEVGKLYKISSDPNDRGLAGSSSGGIAAFTAAWERPDAFRRVISYIGSFTNLRGGGDYASLIRKMEPKPLRIFLQDGSSDQNIYSGSWYLANQTIASALEYAGYDATFVTGTEGHNSRHGAAILPDALRWLWRDYPQPIAASKGAATSVRHYITMFLDPEHDWELVGEGYQATEGPAVDKDGNVYFTAAGSRIFKAAPGSKPVLFKENTGGAVGLMFGPDGRLYAAESERKRVVAYGPTGAPQVLSQGVEPNDLAVSSKGAVYFTSPAEQRIYRIDPKGTRRVVFDGKKDGNILFPNGVRLAPDESLLVVADTVGRTVWSFQITEDGGLANGQPFHHLQLPDDVSQGPVRSGADGMTFDDTGHLYVATKLGIQILDQPGRVVGIIRPPGTEDLSNVVFGGKDLQTLYATAGGKVWRRTLRRKGVFPWQLVKLPQPQL